MAVTDLTGTGWIIDETVNYPSTSSSYTRYFSLNFASNDESFTQMQLSVNTSGRTRIVYVYPNGGAVRVKEDDNVWINEAYRTVNIIDGRDVTLSNALNFFNSYATRILRNFTATYVIKHGTWVDGTIARKTETVQEGTALSQIPTGMIPAYGYEGGSWDEDPTGVVLTEDKTFTYDFQKGAAIKHTVTFAVQNGTWNTGATAPMTEEVEAGNRPQDIPTDIIPNTGYELGSWDASPDVPIYSDVTFTYVCRKVTPGPGPTPAGGLNYFTLDGRSSLDFGVYIGGQKTYNAPQRDVSKIKIPGRNGDLIQDNGRFLNVQVPYNIVVMGNFRYRTDDLKAWLLQTSAYRKLVDTYHPDTYRWARVNAGINFETSAFNLTGKTQVIFDCKPQRFLDEGDEPVTLSSTGTLENPTLFDAEPIIIVYGSGDGELSINNKRIQIENIGGNITIDCELKECYKDGIVMNQKVTIDGYTFPVLQPGENFISLANKGGITSVEITPKWWTI